MKKLFIIGIVFLLVMGVAFSALDDDVVAYYKLDETTGTTADNAEGTASRDGTANNARVFTSNTGTSGKINSGADFTQGLDNIVSAQSLQTVTTQSYWVKHDDATGVHHINDYSVSSGSHRLLIQIIATGHVRAFASGASGTVYRDSSVTVDNDAWRHIVAIFSQTANTIDIYIDGVLANGGKTGSNFGTISNTNNLYLGTAKDGSNGFNGFMDEVGFWDRALSASEVEDLYDAQVDGFSSGQYPTFGAGSSLVLGTPTITAGANGYHQVGAEGWFKTGSLTIKSDYPTGVTLDACQREITGGDWSGATIDTVNEYCHFTSSFSVDRTIKFRARELSTDDWSQSVGLVLKVDNTAPTSTKAITAGTLGDNDFYTTDVTVSISATDNAGGSGVDTILYCVDSAQSCTPNLLYSEPFVISTAGSNYVRISSTDNVGNVETVAWPIDPIKIDKLAPVSVGSITAGAVGLDGWYTSMVTYSITVTDATSGVATKLYCVDSDNTCVPDTSFTTAVNLFDGATNYVRHSSTDNAGNVETTQSSGIIKVDLTNPSIVTRSPADRDWGNTTYNITLSATDATSGVGQYQSCITTGASCTPINSASVISITTDGAFTVCARAIDNSGRTGATECSAQGAYKHGDEPELSTTFTVTAENARTNVSLSNFSITINGYNFTSPISLGSIVGAQMQVEEEIFYTDPVFSAVETAQYNLNAGCTFNYPIRFQKETLNGTERFSCYNHFTGQYDFVGSVVSTSDSWTTLRLLVARDENTNETVIFNIYQFDGNAVLIDFVPVINFLGLERNYDITIGSEDYFTETFTDYNVTQSLNARLFRLGEIEVFVRDTNTNNLLAQNVSIKLQNGTNEVLYNFGAGTGFLVNLSLGQSYQLVLESENYDTSYQTIIYDGVTLNRTFYMQTNGTLMRVTVQDVTGKRLSNANVVIRTYVDGVITDIQQKFSDVNGVASFLLDASKSHLISVTKDDYIALTNLQIDFGEDNLLVIMDITSSTITPTSFDGMQWSLEPFNFALSNNTVYNFSFSIDSSVHDLEQFGIFIYNGNTLLSFNTSNVINQGGIVTLMFNTSNYRALKVIGTFTAEGFPQQKIQRIYYITDNEKFTGSMLELRERMQDELNEFSRVILWTLLFVVMMIVFSVFVTGLPNVLITTALSIAVAWLLGLNMFFLTGILTILLLLIVAVSQER